MVHKRDLMFLAFVETKDRASGAFVNSVSSLFVYIMQLENSSRLDLSSFWGVEYQPYAFKFLYF